ncbi:MAG: hypothetical protein HYS32_02515 [Candidatus Woesearchaeota archaeon]|nr:MAG: hypothetical protein HYS32_02515 [Candidatus Woesearchaeota archaeon]
MKKAIVDLPLIYIFALIVSALILVFGLTQVFKLKSSAEQIEIGQFKLSIEKQIDEIYNLDKGSSLEVIIPVTEKIKEVCFVDNTKTLSTTNAKLGDLAFLNPSHNVFIIGEDLNSDKSFNAEHLKPDISPICFSTKGKLNIILENKGRYVSVDKK